MSKYGYLEAFQRVPSTEITRVNCIYRNKNICEMAEGLNCLFDLNLRNKPLMSYINFILNDHKFKIATVKQSGLATLSI